MNELFTSIEAFIASVEAKAVDAAHKGAEVLEDAAKWLRAEADGVKMEACSPSKAAELHARLSKCCDADCGKKAATAINPANLQILVQLVLTLLNQFLPKSAT